MPCPGHVAEKMVYDHGYVNVELGITNKYLNLHGCSRSSMESSAEPL